MPPMCHETVTHRHSAEYTLENSETIIPETCIESHKKTHLQKITDKPGKPWATSASQTKHKRSWRVAQFNQPIKPTTNYKIKQDTAL